MRIAIILFSPSGHTRKVGKMIQTASQEKGNEVVFININKKKDLINIDSDSNKLKEILGTYDLLFIGAPIYAGHAENHIIKLIKALPSPSTKQSRSDLVVPFVTYGGAHSLLGLEEMGKALKKKGYKSILGLKVACYHTLSGEFTKPILVDKPGAEEQKLVEECVDKAIQICKHKDQAVDCSKAFHYSPLIFKIVLGVLTQERMHKKHKTLSVNSNCVQCKKCISACPINNVILKNGKIQFQDQCILCGECYNACEFQAINFDYPKNARKILKDGELELEKPLSCIYS